MIGQTGYAAKPCYSILPCKFYLSCNNYNYIRMITQKRHTVKNRFKTCKEPLIKEAPPCIPFHLQFEYRQSKPFSVHVADFFLLNFSQLPLLCYNNICKVEQMKHIYRLITNKEQVGFRNGNSKNQSNQKTKQNKT